MNLAEYDDLLDDLNDTTLNNEHFTKYPVEKVAKIDLNIHYRKESKFSEDLGISYLTFKNLSKRLVHVRSTCQMKKNGKIRRMKTWVVVGNKNGLIGLGEGASEDITSSIQQATNKAIKNMIFIERYDKRTICHDIERQDDSTKIRFFPRPPGFGLKTHPLILEICQCVGIKDMAAKIVYGSTNALKIISTTLNALASQRTSEMIAKGRGKVLREINYTYYGVSDPH